MTNELNKPLSDEEIVQLDDFLLSADDDEQRLPVDEAHGFITAKLVGGAAMDNDAWVHSIWGEPAFKSDVEKQQMTDLLLRLQQDIAEGLNTGNRFEPLVAEIEDEGETIEAWEGWCFGFMLGVSEDEARWVELPENEQSLLAPIAKLAMLHTEDDFEMDDEEYQMMVELIAGSVSGLKAYWDKMVLN